MSVARRNIAVLVVVLAFTGATAFAQSSQCVAGATTLCLNNQRFQVDVQWKDFAGNTGVGRAIPLTSDTGYFWFFSNTNVELVVKVLDGRPLNNHFWVFFGALSNVEYTMRVTDKQTGRVKTYFNPSGRFASVGDTEAFSASEDGNPAQSYVVANGASTFAEPAAVRVGSALSTCVATETSLCLSEGRFRVEVAWKDFAGNTGVGKAIALTSETGYFWFFSNTNVELVVKVLDARGLGNKFWVFYGALSNVEYEMTVTDTLTGNVSTYFNPSGRFASAGDTAAFNAGFKVVAHPDPSRAVSREIPITGGSISATAANGTVFNLTIPPDALLSKETITLTPVAGIDGLPLTGGLVGAVDLAPAGLRLFQAATLTVTPTVPVPIAEEITFAWRGNGDEFFLYPPELDKSKISMKLLHFSGYGVGRGTAADQAAQQLRVPAGAEDALSQRLQEVIANRRRVLAQSKGLVAFQNEAEFFRQMEERLRDYYNSSLKAELEVAKTNCTKAKGIMQKALSWARSAELLGLGGEFAGEIQGIHDTLITALVNCYNKSFDTCVSRNDPAQVREMLSFKRQLSLLGAESRVEDSKIERCARFELDYESVIEELEPHGTAFKWRHQVKATVPLTFSFATGPTGSGELVYSVTYTGPAVSPCSTTTVGSNSVFQVTRTDINLNAFEGDAAPPSALTMEYDPGYPAFVFSLLCPMAPPAILSQERWRAEYYDHHHSGEQSGSGFIARDWSRVGGGVFARRTYQISNAFAVETTIMNLKHKPQ